MDGLRFEEMLVDAKDVKVGNYILIDVNGQNKFAQVMVMNSVKNGKHGSAKVSMGSKLLDNGANHHQNYNGSDKISVYKQVKMCVKLVDISDTVITYSDDSGAYETIDLRGRMNQEDIEKITNTVKNTNSEVYELSLRALPNFYKLDFIRASSS